jgi:fructokinase
MEGQKKAMPSSPSSPIVGIGELLWDLLPAGPRLGGTTANFSVLCARLGEAATLVSRVGRDELGAAAMQQLQQIVPGRSFNLEHIQTSATLPTGTVTVRLDAEGRPHYTIDEPVAWDEIALKPDLIELAGQASVVCFGTLAQRNQASSRSIRAFLEATAPGCVRVCDANLRMPFCTPEVLGWALDHATVLKISDEELPELTHMLRLQGRIEKESGGAPVDPAALTEWAGNAAHALLAAAPQTELVAITLGSNGSLLADRNGTHRHRGIPVKVADTIGAGDAFTAGLVFAYLREADLEQIAAAANLCGSYVASQEGATPELPAEVLSAIHAALD